MPTIADELRRLADLLDKNWDNRFYVLDELIKIVRGFRAEKRRLLKLREERDGG